MANGAEKTNTLQASLRQVRFFSANPARGIIRPYPSYPWLIPSQPLPSSGLARKKLVAEAFCLTGSIEKYGSEFIRISKALEDYPEARLEISESGHGLMLSFQKVAHQPESQPVTDQVTAEILRLLTVMRCPLSRLEIQSRVGLKHLPHLRNAYLQPVMKDGLIEMTIPKKPLSRHQKYRLTPAGKALTTRKANAGNSK